MDKKKYDIITIGGATLDVFMKDDDFKVSKNADQRAELCMAYGEKLIVDDVHFTYGGGGMNTAVSFARFGLNVGFIGIVGNDEIGKGILGKLSERNVATEYVAIVDDGKSGLSVALHARERERTLLLFRGVNDMLKPANLNVAELQATKWLYLSHLSGSSCDCIEVLSGFLQNNSDVSLAWNPGSTQLKKGVDYLQPLLKQTTILNLNKEEAELLSGIHVERDHTLSEDHIDDLTSLHQALYALGPRIVAITDGIRGASIFDGKEVITSKNHEMAPVKDTTGAGDAFGSGFVAGYMEANDVNTALKWGIVQSGAVITDFGAQNGLLTRKRLVKEYDHL